MEEALEAEEICPLHADFEPAMFQPYVLDLHGLGFGPAHVTQCLAFVVLMRRDGALLALPELAMPGDALAAGDTASPSSLVGPHLKVLQPWTKMPSCGNLCLSRAVPYPSSWWISVQRYCHT